MIEPWIERELVAGLQGLLALRLDGAPAADMVNRTLDTWLVALEPHARGWHESLDARRVKTAFQRLFSTCERWPAPKKLLEHMPPRERGGVPALPKLDSGQRERNRTRLADLVDRLKKRKAITQEPLA
jgi:hypothetical protein